MPKTYRYTILHDGPEKKITIIEGSKVKATLETLQKLVDGHIELLPKSYHGSLNHEVKDAIRAKSYHIWINEEGKFRPDFQDNLHFDLVHTVAGHTWVDPVRGPAVVEEAYNA